MPSNALAVSAEKMANCDSKLALVAFENCSGIANIVFSSVWFILDKMLLKTSEAFKAKLFKPTMDCAAQQTLFYRFILLSQVEFVRCTKV
jgi:hypothetical protein